MKDKIINICKNQWKNLLIVITYMIIGCVVYGIWFHSMWKLWYVDLLIILVIITTGCIIGYLYIKAEINSTKVEKIEEKPQEIVENKEEN